MRTRLPSQLSRPGAAGVAAILLLTGQLVPLTVAAQTREEVKPGEEPKLTRAPQLIKFVPALYPLAAQRQGIEGRVQLVLVIDAAGKVAKVDIERAPGGGLGEAAAMAARQFRFTPAELDGKPAPVRIRYSYNFVIETTFTPRLPDWMLERKKRAEDDFVLVGRVRERGTRLPIPGAAVAVPSRGLEVQTDGKGQFFIRDLPAGKVRIEAFSLEANKEAVEVEIREGEQTKIDFYLQRLRSEDYETVVRGKRRQTTVSRITLRRKQLTTVPGTFGDPVRVVENLPGLARVPYVGGALLVRGAAPNDSGVFLDSNRIPLIYHFLGGPSVLNPQFLDRIDYYAGNADVRYGRLIAGVIDVATRNTFTGQLKGAVDINLLNASVFLNVPITDRVSVAGAVRRSYIDALLPAILDASGQTATTVVPVYYDYQVRVDVKLRGDDRLHLLAFGSDDNLEVVSNEPEQDFSVSLDSKITFHRFLAQWDAQWTRRLRSRLQPIFGFDVVNFDTGEAGVAIKSWTIGLRHDLEYKLSRRTTLRFGIDASAVRSGFEAEIPLLPDYRNPAAPIDFRPGSVGNPLSADTQKVSINQWLGGVAVYADGIFNVTDKLQLIPGSRFELIYYLGHARPSVTPRLTARYALLPDTTIKAAAGLFSQAPPPQQANAEAGNPDLQLEHAIHYSIGVEQKLLEALKLDASLYLIQRYDQAVRTDRVRFVDGVPDRLVYANAGGGTSFGLEVLLKHEVTRNFYGWLSYTLSRSQQRREEGGELVRFAFDQTHLLTLVGSYRLGGGWEAGLRFRLASGRPETPVLGGIYDSDGDLYQQIFGQERSVNRPLFHQLDLRLEKNWIFKLWRFGVYLDVQNVYNAENPEATLFDYRFRESGPLRGLPVLPTFGVKGSF